MLYELIEVMFTQNVRCAIRHDHVHFFAVEDFLNLLDCLLSCDVALNKCGSFDWLYFKQVDRAEMGLAQQIDTFLG